MRSCEGTGKNIEQAIQNALLELKASRDDVDIKILSEGGFLKKAKVLVSISEDALDKYEKREKLKEDILNEDKNDEDFAETFIKQKIKITETNTDEKNEKKEPVKVITDEEYVASVQPKEQEKREKNLTGEEFLNSILSALDLKGEIERTTDERFERYHLKGENLNDLIGHHGECMLSLSYLMSLVCQTEDRKRIVLDIENYREKREASLVELAKRIANKVAKSGRYFKLEPMDASERKIIHTALQNDERVTTMSKGEEPHRHLIVFPREYKQD